MDTLLKVLPHTSTKITGRINAASTPLTSWEDWAKRTGELPPDFAAMPSIPDLPDPPEGMTSDGWLSVLFARPVKIPGAASAALSYGGDLSADLYYPENVSGKMPPLGAARPLRHRSDGRHTTRTA